MGKKNATAHSAQKEAVTTVKSSELPVAAADVAVAAETKPASEGDAVEPASAVPETTARGMVVWGYAHKCYNFVKNQLSIDLRSLALCRIALGIVVMMDVVYRFPEIEAFYTDRGIMPRETWLKHHGDPTYGINLKNYRHSSSDMSIHLGFTMTHQVQILFLIHFIAALNLAVGWHSTISCVVTWMFQHSLHARTPILQHRGDELIRLYLLWLIFIPEIGSRFSVDRVIRDSSAAAMKKKMDDVEEKRPESDKVTSLALLWLQLQIFAVYFLAAWAKDGEDWTSGWAAHKTLALDCFKKPNMLTEFLFSRPLLCYFSHWATLGLEWVGPFMLFATPRTRIAAFVGFFGMQATFGITLQLFLFPFISTVLVMPTLPHTFWDTLGPSDATVAAVTSAVETILDYTTTPQMPIITAPTPPTRVQKMLSWVPWLVKHSFLLLFAVPAMIWHLVALKVMKNVPEPYRYIGLSTGAAQNWDMFAPTVMDSDGWTMMPGVLADGSHVDAIFGMNLQTRPDFLQIATDSLAGGPAEYKRVRNTYMRTPSIHWFHLTLKLNSKDGCDRTCGAIAGWICRKWNTVHWGGDPHKKLQSFKIVYQPQRTVKGNCTGMPPFTNATVPCAKEVYKPASVMWRHKCFPNSKLPNAGIGPPMIRELGEINGMSFADWKKRGRHVDMGEAPVTATADNSTADPKDAAAAKPAPTA